jgi:hypothetical protein
MPINGLPSNRPRAYSDPAANAAPKKSDARDRAATLDQFPDAAPAEEASPEIADAPLLTETEASLLMQHLDDWKNKGGTAYPSRAQDVEHFLEQSRFETYDFFPIIMNVTEGPAPDLPDALKGKIKFIWPEPRFGQLEARAFEDKAGHAILPPPSLETKSPAPLSQANQVSGIVITSVDGKQVTHIGSLNSPSRTSTSSSQHFSTPGSPRSSVDMPSTPRDSTSKRIKDGLMRLLPRGSQSAGIAELPQAAVLDYNVFVVPTSFLSHGQRDAVEKFEAAIGHLTDPSGSSYQAGESAAHSVLPSLTLLWTCKVPVTTKLDCLAELARRLEGAKIPLPHGPAVFAEVRSALLAMQLDTDGLTASQTTLYKDLLELSSSRSEEFRNQEIPGSAYADFNGWSKP